MLPGSCRKGPPVKGLGRGDPTGGRAGRPLPPESSCQEDRHPSHRKRCDPYGNQCLQVTKAHITCSGRAQEGGRLPRFRASGEPHLHTWQRISQVSPLGCGQGPGHTRPRQL